MPITAYNDQGHLSTAIILKCDVL